MLPKVVRLRPESRPEGPRGGWDLEREQRVPLYQLGGLGERRKFCQRGLGRSPRSRWNRIWCRLPVVKRIWHDSILVTFVRNYWPNLMHLSEKFYGFTLVVHYGAYLRAIFLHPSPMERGLWRECPLPSRVINYIAFWCTFTAAYLFISLK